MYFPFLRARQFEIIALREFVGLPENQHKIIPILEPVKEDLKALVRGIKIFEEFNNPYTIVLNSPFCKLSSTELMDQLDSNLEKQDQIIYALHVHNDYWSVRNELTNINGNVMLICSQRVDTENPDFLDLIENPKVIYILSNENRKLSRRIKSLNKNLIRWDDNFISQNKNSDYLTAPEEKFTEEHLYYFQDGYFGFSDFGPLSSQYSEGGSMPYAVAIHLTYEKANEEIWMKHFTSISNDDQANVQGKFAEAAQKAVAFLDENNITTKASLELRNYFREEKFPGLGIVKKISIKHHIELINSIF